MSAPAAAHAAAHAAAPAAAPTHAAAPAAAPALVPVGTACKTVNLAPATGGFAISARVPWIQNAPAVIFGSGDVAPDAPVVIFGSGDVAPVADKPVPGKPVPGKPVAGKPAPGKPAPGKPVPGGMACAHTTKQPPLGKVEAPCTVCAGPVFVDRWMVGSPAVQITCWGCKGKSKPVQREPQVCKETGCDAVTAGKSYCDEHLGRRKNEKREFDMLTEDQLFLDMARGLIGDLALGGMPVGEFFLTLQECAKGFATPVPHMVALFHDCVAPATDANRIRQSQIVKCLKDRLGM